jgi:integrase/ribosomal protein L37E
MKYDPHNRAERLRAMIRRLKDGSAGVSKADVKTICDFYKDMLAESMGIVRLYKYVEVLRRLTRRIKKPLAKLTKEDIKDIVIDIESEPKLSAWSKHDFKVGIRRLFKWLRGGNVKHPPEVDWIKVHVKNKHKLPEELISEEEIKLMLQGCEDIRDRTLIQMLFESGCRISEILTIQLKNIQFDDYGVLIGVTGKTGDRRIRLIASVPSLSAWLDLHPYKDNSESYLFIRRAFGKEDVPVPFRYEYAGRMIRDLAKKVGIKKRVYPHLFRHSRATMLASKLTEAQMKEYFGWTQSSDMASIYVHMSGRDVDDAILKMNGLKKGEDNITDSFKAVRCSRCNESNSPASRICSNCGFGFKAEKEDPQEQEKNNTLIAELMKDPEFQALIMKKLMGGNMSEIREVIQCF